MAKRAFILGAGFSKAVGMPLAGELTEPAIRRASYFDENSADDNACHRWLNSFQKRLFRASSRVLSIEEVFHYAYFDMEAFKLFEHVEPHSKLQRRARHWLNELQVAVIEELWDRQIEAVNEGRVKRLDAWAHALTSDDVVIVFNYDQLAESSIALSGKEWNHGFEDEITGVTVFKLHGSIDWLIARCADEFHPLCRSTNCTVLYRSQNESGTNQAVRRLSEKKDGYDTTTLLRINSRELLEKNICPDLSFAWEEKRPGIAALGAYKPLSSIPALGKVWRNACLSLHDVDEVVVVGFSFSEFDATASLQFGGVTSIRADGERRLKRLTVVDPNAERIIERAKPIFDPVEVCTFAVPHEEFDWNTI